MYDVIIKNGLIYDGKGSEPFNADIGIKNEEISEIQTDITMKAEKIIDADGQAVTPGFIDTHGHSDIIAWAMEDYDYKIRQGVTTEVMGSCGLSAAPSHPEHQDLLDEYLDTIKCGVDFEWEWGEFSEYLNYIDSYSIVNNLIPLVGHGTVRISTMGFQDKSPSKTQLESMQKSVRNSLEVGAFGLSAGLVYPPGTYGSTEELVTLNQIVSEFDGVFSVHMRNEGDNLLGAIEEVIDIAERAEVTLLISHLKSMGRDNWGKSDRALQLIEEARDSGVSVWADQYPYTANSTFLNALVPPSELNAGLSEFLVKLKNDSYAREIISRIENNEGADWENFVANAGGWSGVLVLSLPETPEWNGMRISEIAEEENKSPGEIFIELLKKNRGRGLVVTFTMSDEDVNKIMKAPFQMFGSDGLPGESGGHPRIYGTFPRVYDRYAGENKLLDLPQAVRKMTSLPAGVLNLDNRGVIAEGKVADINIIDLSRFKDRASYQDPLKPPIGIDKVLLAGEIAVDNDSLVRKDLGRVLRS